MVQQSNEAISQPYAYFYHFIKISYQPRQTLKYQIEKNCNIIDCKMNLSKKYTDCSILIFNYFVNIYISPQQLIQFQNHSQYILILSKLLFPSFLTPIASMIQNISQKSEQSDPHISKQSKQRKKWELEETRKYYQFVQKYQSVLEQSQKKQKQRIYNRMSDYVGTRSTHQCRSHHQKVMKRHHSIEQFMEAFVKKMELIRSKKNLQKTSQQIKKALLSLNQPIPQEQYCRATLKQAQAKFDYHQKTNKATQLQSQCRKEYHQSYSQEHQKLNSQTFKAFQDPNPKHINFPQNRFNRSFFKNKNTQKDSLPGPKVDKTDIFNFEKPSSPVKKEPLFGIRENLRSQEDHLKKSDQINKNICQKSSLQISSKSKPFKIASKVTHVNLPLNSINLPIQKQVSIPVPACEPLPKEPQYLAKNVQYICSSIIQSQNLDLISPLLSQKLVQLTPKKIKINYKQEEFYKMWIECVKVQEVSQSEKVSSNCQQIEKEDIIPYNVISSERKIIQSHPPHCQPTNVPDERIFSQSQIHQKRSFMCPNEKQSTYRSINTKNLYYEGLSLKNSHHLFQTTNKLVPKCLDLQTFFNQRSITAKTEKALRKTPPIYENEDNFNHEQKYQLKNRHEQSRNLQKRNFFHSNPFLSLYSKSQNFDPQKLRCQSSNPYLYGPSDDNQKEKISQRQKFTRLYHYADNQGQLNKQNSLRRRFA